MKSDFQFIIDKVLRMLNSWGSKLILLAGRIALVKSVVLSYPTFHSSHSLIPKGILDEIDKLCRGFIWNKLNGGVGMHYVSWDIMCKPMKYGGRGLHSCSSKVGPLRAKLAWKYVNDTESQLHKVFFPKYGLPWENDAGRNSGSVAWKLINYGAKFLKPIVRWDIANGEDVDVLMDTWILHKSLNRLPTFVASSECIGLSVDKLISEGRWNLKELYKLFGYELVALIMKIPIKHSLSEDKLELLHQISRRSIASLAADAMEQDFPLFKNWDWIKMAKLRPRVECFWWRLFHNAVPTNQFLAHRRLIDCNFCLRGCQDIENLDHVESKCIKLRRSFYT